LAAIAVSIQLVSPASGEKKLLRAQEQAKEVRTVSIQLVSPASGESLGSSRPNLAVKSFHSISFPSEWGVIKPENILDFLRSHLAVSIQLVSPASGELIVTANGSVDLFSFPFN